MDVAHRPKQAASCVLLAGGVGFVGPQGRVADGTAFDLGGAAHQVQIVRVVGIAHHAQQIIGRDGEVLAEAQQGGHQHVGLKPDSSVMHCGTGDACLTRQRAQGQVARWADLAGQSPSLASLLWRGGEGDGQRLF